MKRFHFSLETLLSIRQQREQDARLELAGITSECNRLDEQLGVLARERTASVSRGKDDFKEDLMRWYAYRELYLQRLDRRIEEIQEDRAALELRREDAAAAYREAHREVFVLEKLREKRYALYRRESAREEQRSIDDIAGSRYHSGTDL